MKIPDEKKWARVEELAEELGNLSGTELTQRITMLAASGESSTVLTVLGSWLSLPPPPTTLRPGAVLGGRYLLRELIGEGGMGSVWRAHQELVAREVAVKVIHPYLVSPAFNSRFGAEVKALGQLNHPGIVRIFDAGLHQTYEGPATPFFAMELIEGDSLDAWAKKRRSQPVEILAMVAKVCAALATAHELQIVHRDLKPSNILVKGGGEPVIVDFGVARLRGLILGETEGSFSGTPNYAAPEQHLGRDHDFRSGESVDIYATGAVLFELLSGRKLFETPRGASILELREIILQSKVPKLSEFLPDCPPDLEEIVGRATRRDPADRFYSIAALGRAIDRVATKIGSPQSNLPKWAPTSGVAIPNTNWILIEKIGEGGAGEVWIGGHKQLGERRVFKFCEDEEKARTLKREVTLFRLLKEHVGKNPHFIPLHEVSLDEPPFYLMMEHVEACDLEAWCEAQPGKLATLSEEARIRIVIQAAEALQAAHDAGILHRDIKPANLLIRGNTETLHVFVADFGIGQIVTDQLLQDRTRLGFTRTVSELRGDRLSGTLLYLAPEVLEGSQATARSDIYSIGIVLWQLLAGNLHAALDPSDWFSRIDDPILRGVLRRCLAGSPEKRWASASEFAQSLRTLPEQRASEKKRLEEIAARERAAYRRGMLRTAAVAGVIVIAIAALALLAFAKRREAETAHGAIALNQAQNLRNSEAAGRRENGKNLLDLAARSAITNLPALRSAAAGVLGLMDLVPDLRPPAYPPAVRASTEEKHPGETARAFSDDGSLLAIGLDVDGRSGRVEIFEAQSGKRQSALERKEFPWMPVAEPGVLKFSADKQMLAVGGAATSRHILIMDVKGAALKAYIYHASDLLSCAWHPNGEFLATGCADGLVRIWDINAATTPTRNSGPASQFDLPPALDSQALDSPLHILQGQRGPVKHLAFGQKGKWLAVLDDVGYLRIFDGFPLAMTETTLPSSAHFGISSAGPALAIELHLENPANISALSAKSDSIVVEWKDGHRQQLRVLPAEIPEELRLAPGLVKLAWDESDELCVSTLTDLWFLKSSPLEPLFVARSRNPLAVGSGDGKWFAAFESGLENLSTKSRTPFQSSSNAMRFPLSEAEKGQASIVDLSSAADGRIAAYCGRRIQFFFQENAAPISASQLASAAPGSIRDFFWDQPGQLLAVLFATTNGFGRIESWKTTADFPPKCEALPARSFQCDHIAAANFGLNLTARNASDGLFLYNPADDRKTLLDSSTAARQNAPFAMKPDGSMLAYVVDRAVVRLAKMPTAAYFADLHPARASSLITSLAWSQTGALLAALTEDGSVLVWNLAPWRDWLAAHHID